MSQRRCGTLPARLLDHDGPRLLIINNMPSYYRTEPFEALTKRFDSEVGGVSLVAYQVRRDSHGRGEWFYTPDDELPFDYFMSSADTKPSTRITRYPMRVDLNIWRRYRPSHIFAAGWDSPLSLSAAGFARLNGARLGVWIESNSTTSRRRGLASNAFRRTFLRSADFAVVPTAASADYVEELAGHSVRIRQLLNPVKWQRLPDAPDPGARRLVFLGDLSRRKGFDLFAGALASSSGATWQGVAWGRDTEGLAACSPINCDIKTARPLSEIIPNLRATDIVVIPSRVDPAPLTYSEALALGLRVLVSDHIAYGQDALTTQGACRVDASSPRSIIGAAEAAWAVPRPSSREGLRVTPTHWAKRVCEELQSSRDD